MLTRNLTDAVKLLQDVALKIITDYEAVYTTREARVIGVLRTTAEQWELFKAGRQIKENPDGTYIVLSVSWNKVKTQLDGRTKFSKHLPDPIEPRSKAIDFGVFIGGKYMEDSSYYYPFQFLAHKYGLVSGGDFKGSWKDWPHVEVPGPIYVPPAGTIPKVG